MGVLHRFVESHAIDRSKQYGFVAAARQILRASVRSVYCLNASDVYIVPDFRGFEYNDPLVRPLSHERVLADIERGQLVDRDMQRRVLDFCDSGYSGLCIEIDGRLAAHAWTQFSGDYWFFGKTWSLRLKTNWAVFLGLFVLPEFRGQGLGGKLNAARLASVPSGWVPIGLIVPENRYAIRNWCEYGFQRVVALKQSRWIGCRPTRKVTSLSDIPAAIDIATTLEEGQTV